MLRSAAARPPSLVRTEFNGSISLAAAGSWTAANVHELERFIEEARATCGGRRATIEAQGITELDTFGATLLSQLTLVSTPAGQPAQIVDLEDRFGLNSPPFLCKLDRPI